jgi:hypothetical protein
MTNLYIVLKNLELLLSCNAAEEKVLERELIKDSIDKLKVEIGIREAILDDSFPDECPF